MRLHFALVDFTKVKVGDVLRVEQKLYDNAGKDYFSHDRHILVTNVVNASQLHACVVWKDGKVPQYTYTIHTKDTKYYRSEPKDWGDGITAFKMQWELEGRLSK